MPWNVAFAQSTATTTEPPPASSQVAPPAKVKRSFNAESIKRAKLTRLRKDVALTDDQATKVKPMIDAYVNEMQAIKNRCLRRFADQAAEVFRGAAEV
jgi:hypothetical protein